MRFTIFARSELHLLHRAGQQVDLLHFSGHGFCRGRRSLRYVLDRSTNILLADNDAAFREELGSQLRATNYVVHTASSIAEGLMQLGSDAVVDLVICDAEGDELAGLATLRAYRSDPRLELTPFILLRQPQSTFSILDCLRAGADDCVVKMNNAIEEVVARASALIDRSRRLITSMLADFDIDCSKTKPWTLDKTGLPQSDARLVEQIEDAVTDLSRDVNLTIQMLAEATALTVRGLERACNRLIGLTPARLIRKVRLVECHQLICEGQPIKVARHRAGFKDHVAVSQYFLEEFGLTPLELKRLVCSLPARSR